MYVLFERNKEHVYVSRTINLFFQICAISGVCLNCHKHLQDYPNIYSVLVSVSCPKALYHLESDNIFRITVVVADWLG